MSGRRLFFLISSLLVILLAFYGYRYGIRYCINYVIATNNEQYINKLGSTKDFGDGGNDDTAETNGTKNGRESLLDLFPYLPIIFPAPDDWRVKNANVLKTKNQNLFFLFRDMKINGNVIQFVSANVIILPGNNELTEKQKFEQAIVIESTGKTNFTFTQDINIKNGLDFTTFNEGNLYGIVTIRSQGKTDSVKDNFYLETNGISFNMKQIVAATVFRFTYGECNVSGSNLTIDLDIPPLTKNRPDSTKVSGPIKVENENILKSIQKEGNLGGGISLERIALDKLDKFIITVDSENLSSSVLGDTILKKTPEKDNGSNSKIQNEKLNIEVMCNEKFTLIPKTEEGTDSNNKVDWVARFDENVEVTVHHKDEKSDILSCGRLFLFFLDKEFHDVLSVPENHTYYTSLKKNQPTGRLSKMEMVMLKAVRSEDHSVKITAPRFQFSAEGDEFIFNMPENCFYLISNDVQRRVRMTQSGMSIYSTGMRYKCGQDGKLGTIVSDKNGLLDVLYKENGKVVQLKSTWNGGLMITPVVDNQTDLVWVTMNGGISFELEGTGSIKADEAHFWFEPLNDKLKIKESSDGAVMKNMESLRPHSAQFQKNIQMQTNMGTAVIRDTMRMRFLQIPENGMTPPISATDNNKKVSPTFAVSTDNKKATFFGNEQQKYSVKSDFLDLWVIQKGRETVIDKLILSNNVSFQETTSVNKGEIPLCIQGDKVEIKNPQNENTIINLSGNAASFIGRGLNLWGNSIVINRAENNFDIFGPGKLILNVPDKNNTPGNNTRITQVPQNVNNVSATKPLSNFKIGQMEVNWSKKLSFNGTTLSFQANDNDTVRIINNFHQLQCPQIRLSLKHPIHLFENQYNNNDVLNDLAIIECLGTSGIPVHIKTFMDSMNQNKQDIESVACQGEVQSFILDYDTMDFSAKGKGWFRATTKNTIQKKPETEENTMTTSKKQTTTLLANNKTFNRKTWGHLHLTFQGNVIGNINRKYISFINRVSTAYCESDKQKTELDVLKPNTNLEQVVTLYSNELQLVLSPDNDKVEENNIEMRANGNVIFQYANVFGRGDSMVYSNEKQKVYLKGDSINNASLYTQENPGAKQILYGRFQNGSYNLSSGQLDIEDYNNSN